MWTGHRAGSEPVYVSEYVIEIMSRSIGRRVLATSLMSRGFGGMRTLVLFDVGGRGVFRWDPASRDGRCSRSQRGQSA